MDIWQELTPHLRCPDSGARLERLEPWLYAAADRLFPSFCGTPLMVADLDRALERQFYAIARATAEWGESREALDWLFSRCPLFDPPDAPPQDAEIRGEGYPGFWEAIGRPGFIDSLVKRTPEDQILSALDDFTGEWGLDLGCGQGGMSQRMAARCRRVIGVESNFYLAALANRLAPAAEIQGQAFDPLRGYQPFSFAKQPAANVLALCGDLGWLPFEGLRFDWVHFGHVLDLTDDPIAALERAASLLKPDGLLTVCAPWDVQRAAAVADTRRFLFHSFRTLWEQDAAPWLRYNHRRRFILHEDWLWIGKHR